MPELLDLSLLRGRGRSPDSGPGTYGETTEPDVPARIAQHISGAAR